jgi:hypothetical protein
MEVLKDAVAAMDEPRLGVSAGTTGAVSLALQTISFFE